VALAVCLLFDPVTDRAVRQLWARLEAQGIPTLLTHTHRRHVPHLSYAVFRTFDVPAVRAAVGALPGPEPACLRFDAVGLFRRRRAALIAASTAALLERQRAVVEAGEATGADLHRHYRPGTWIPHSSLATSVRRVSMATLAAAAFDILPLEAQLQDAVLIDSGTGERWSLGQE
jgi:2'-5' RNA ligase superfamily